MLMGKRNGAWHFGVGAGSVTVRERGRDIYKYIQKDGQGGAIFTQGRRGAVI